MSPSEYAQSVSMLLEFPGSLRTIVQTICNIVYFFSAGRIQYQMPGVSRVKCY